MVVEIDAARIKIGLALEYVIANHALDVFERARLGKTAEWAIDHGGIRGRTVEAQRQFDSALGLIVVEVGIEAVDRNHESRAGFELHRAVDAEALELSGGDEALVTADHEGIACRSVTGIAPSVEFLQLIGLVGIGGCQRHAQRIVGELVDKGRIYTVAEFLRPGIERAQIGIGPLRTDSQDTFVCLERTDGAHIDRPDEALADKAGRWCLVNIDLVDDFGRVLVKFDRPVVAGRGLFAPVQQRLGEVGAEPANGDDVCAAVEALRSDARQAGDRFPDGIVGQLADVFCRDRFQDQVAVALGVDRTCQRLAEAGNDDNVFGLRIGVRVSLDVDVRIDVLRDCRCRHRGQRNGKGRHADGGGKSVAICHFKALPKRPGTVLGCLGRSPILDRSCVVQTTCTALAYVGIGKSR